MLSAPDLITLDGLCLTIDSKKFSGRDDNIARFIVPITDTLPELSVYDREHLLARYHVEALYNNPVLAGQYLHIKVRVLIGDAVMIEAKICDTPTREQSVHGLRETIRFQPTYLQRSRRMLDALRGRGLFDRGLHHRGWLTPANVRLCCVCDECAKSFTLMTYHSVYYQWAYFYSERGTSTLIVEHCENGRIRGRVTTIEALLPKSKRDQTAFGYYQALRCPHCLAPYIDFQRYPGLRHQEVYANTLLNVAPQRFELPRAQF